MKVDGNKFKQLREAKLLTVTDIHKLCGVSEGAIRLLESGKTVSPRFSVLQKLAEALDLSHEDLVKAITTESQQASK